MPFDSETAKLAGQKSKRGASERAKILNDLFTEEKAKSVFEKLTQMAESGNIEAIKTFLAYCFGKPESKIDLTSDGEKIGGLSSLTTEQLNQLRIIKDSIETK